MIILDPERRQYRSGRKWTNWYQRDDYFRLGTMDGARGLDSGTLICADRREEFLRSNLLPF